MKRSTAVLALAVVVGQLLLAAAVFDPSPHTGGDNAGYITLAYSLLERGAYLDLQDPAEPIHTKYPPIYPAVLAVGMAMGARTWAALKSFSAVFMTVALLMSFLWAARRRGARFALLVAAILAVSEAYLFHTRWILSDPLFLMLTWCSIWAFGRADEGAGGGAPSLDGEDGRGAAAEPRDAGIDPAGSTDRTTPWLVLAGATAILAFFTRSAGLPLVLAVGILLGLRGRWRLLAAFALAFAIPAMLWWLRAEAGPNYALEFWLVDPSSRSIEVFTLEAGRYVGAGWFREDATARSPSTSGRYLN